MNADERWYERWKRLKEYLEVRQKSLENSVIKYEDKGNKEEAERREEMAQQNQTILTEMARLEKEE